MLDESGWADRLADQVAEAGDAWSRPEAWAGSVEGAQMPAAAIGEMGLIELMLHGWDVARASGQSLDVSDELGAELLRCLEPTLEQGRQFDVYGPPVSVPDDAAAFIRALGLSGRDPTGVPDDPSAVPRRQLQSRPHRPPDVLAGYAVGQRFGHRAVRQLGQAELRAQTR